MKLEDLFPYIGKNILSTVNKSIGKSSNVIDIVD